MHLAENNHCLVAVILYSDLGLVCVWPKTIIRQSDPFEVFLDVVILYLDLGGVCILPETIVGQIGVGGACLVIMIFDLGTVCIQEL